MSKAHMEKKDFDNFENEISILQRLAKKNHPNIMKLHHYFEDWNRLMIVMELCPGIELYKDVLMKDSYDSNKAAFIIKQVLAALFAMHDLDDGTAILHRDIKPENMLITEADSPMPEVKLVDFGESALIRKDEVSHLYKRAGTLTYMAPEVFFANKKSVI